MRFSSSALRLLLLFTLAASFASACERSDSTESPTPSPTGVLVVYSSPTPGQTVLPPPPQGATATPPITPTPSPTPFTHVIVKGDTMGSIALKYGVNLQDLLAANPETDPHFMTIGKTVIVPIQLSGQETPTLPTPTMVPIRSDSPQCYVDLDGGAWCFVLVYNDQEQAIENLSARVGLYGPGGELLASQEALAPLNILGPGEKIPLAAHFPPPAPEAFNARMGSVSALPVAGGKARYLQADIELQETQIDPDGNRAVVKGNVILPNRKPVAGVIWLAVVAYGPDGEVVGVRKWEASEPANKTMPFEITVFSLGPVIDHLDVLVEARPR